MPQKLSRPATERRTCRHVPHPFVGVAQTSLKRMLAYSSIAHGGYILAGIVAGNDVGKAAILFYLAAYALTNLGAFGVIALLGTRERANDEVFVIVQIESAKAVENVDAIAAVEGVDALFIGPNDLSGTLGRLRDQHLIDVSGKTIAIKNLPALQAMLRRNLGES